MPDGTQVESPVKPTGLVDTNGNPLSSENYVPQSKGSERFREAAEEINAKFGDPTSEAIPAQPAASVMAPEAPAVVAEVTVPVVSTLDPEAKVPTHAEESFKFLNEAYPMTASDKGNTASSVKEPKITSAEEDYLRWAGVDENKDKGKSFIDKGKERREAVGGAIDTVADAIDKRVGAFADAAFAAPDVAKAAGGVAVEAGKAVGNEVNDYRREAQELANEAEIRLAMIAEDLSSKTIDATRRLAKSIGPNIMRALRIGGGVAATIPAALLGTGAMAELAVNKAFEGAQRGRVALEESMAQRSEAKMAGMNEGDKDYNRAKGEAERARKKAQQLREANQSRKLNLGTCRGLFNRLSRSVVGPQANTI